MLRSAREIDELLGDLPLDDRLSTILVSVLTHREAMAGLVRLIAATGALASHLSPTNRILVGELLRNAADEVEHRQFERVG